MNKNSNAYIIIYTVVMVVIVATLLTFAATSLKERQDANAENEKKMAVMTALGKQGESFDETITPALLIDGVLTPQSDAKVVLDKLADLKTMASAENDLPLFKYEREGETLYVVPVAGKGLWGDIWGYVALQADGDTIAGVVFDHKGETPGLGAEIASPKYQSLFAGKRIFEGDEFVSVSLRKGGAKDPAHEVDAISGGTKTSDGVSAMLRTSLGHYLPLLRAKRSGAAAEMSNAENVENNE